MSTTTFANAKAVKWNIVDGKAVFLGRQRIWPAAKPSFQMPNDPGSDTNQEITVYVGDVIHLDAGSGIDWIDTYPGLLLMQGNKEVGNYTPGPKGWPSVDAYLPDGSSSKAYISNSKTADLDTTGMNPGTYHLRPSQFFDFGSMGLSLTIHLLPALVPEDVFLQLPDDPFDSRWKLQTIPVVRGQDVILKFPVNPLGTADDSNHPGWRHIVMVGWDSGTNEAVDFIGGNAVQTTAPPGNSNSYKYINHGQTSVNVLNARGIDMYSPIDIRMHMTDRINPGFWVIPVNGNYNTSQYDLQGDGLFYIKLVDHPEPIPPAQILPPKSTTVTIPQGKVAHMQTRLANYNNYYDPDYDGIPIDNITAKAGDKIQIPALTGAGFDLAEVWMDVGSADPTDVPANDGGLQTRYGGGWILPANLAAGTYPIKIGQDVNNPMFDLINIVIH